MLHWLYGLLKLFHSESITCQEHMKSVLHWWQFWKSTFCVCQAILKCGSCCSLSHMIGHFHSRSLLDTWVWFCRDAVMFWGTLCWAILYCRLKTAIIWTSLCGCEHSCFICRYWIHIFTRRYTEGYLGGLGGRGGNFHLSFQINAICAVPDSLFIVIQPLVWLIVFTIDESFH
jgi:hypothetical protein